MQLLKSFTLILLALQLFTATGRAMNLPGKDSIPKTASDSIPKSRLKSIVTMEYSCKLYDADLTNEDDLYGSVSILFSAYTYYDGSVKFKAAATTRKEEGVGVSATISIGDRGIISGGITFSGGDHIRTDLSSLFGFSSGMILNGPYCSFGFQIAWSAKSNSFKGIILPTKDDLNGAAKLLESSNTFPGDGIFGNNLYFRASFGNRTVKYF
jgi:hypothetical protein